MTVRVYALSTCPWCKKVKKLLDEQGTDYISVDVDLAEGEARKEALEDVERLTGRRSFPVTVINEIVIQGYKPEEIKGALDSES